MKKLLIFGDSFGEEAMKNYRLRGKMLKFKSFHQVIRESNIFSEVITYAEGGSDLWTQFELFKEKYTGDEEILWFETHPGRLTVDGVNYVGITHVEASIKDHVAHGLTPPNALMAALQYFKYFTRDTYDKFVHREIVHDIYLRCPSTTMLPGFNNTESSSKLGISGLSAITGKENSVFGITHLNSKYHDLRRNHMTEENGIILGKQIVDYFLTGAKFDEAKFVVPSKTQFGKYFY